MLYSPVIRAKARYGTQAPKAPTKTHTKAHKSTQKHAPGVLVETLNSHRAEGVSVRTQGHEDGAVRPGHRESET